MKPALKRIEEALNQLETRKNAAYPIANLNKRSYSFDLQPPKSDSPTQTRAASPKLPDLGAVSNNSLPTEQSLDSSPPDVVEDTVNSLPTEQSLDSSPPDVIEDTVAGAIAHVVRQIQDLYHSGPIIDGTLECYPPSPQNSDEIREVCFERVIDVEDSNLTSEEISLPGATYRLCGVDAGVQWSYPCPLDQLLSVSVAIARYHKLQQLLQQKYELEQNRVEKDEV